MLGQLIFEKDIPLAQDALVTCEQATTWADLREQAQRFAAFHGGLSKRRVGLSFGSSAQSYAALAALDRLSSDVFLLDANLRTDEAIEASRKLRLGALLAPGHASTTTELEVHELPSEESWSGDSTITILTSGSTGQPKAVRHSWESITRPIRKGVTSAPTWLLTYRPNLYAGMQVMLQCFSDRGTLVVPNPGMNSDSTARLMYDAEVQFVSATPSYWRRLLMFSDTELLKRIPLLQITLGGEIVDQPILDKLALLYPNARLVHIYATTELGRCCSVSDGKAGIPASCLGRPLPDGTELKIQGGELQVRSANSMRMYDPLSSQQTIFDGWFATGDMVEVKNDRVHFAGRKTEMINVAGRKVFPVEIERVIRVVSGVSDVRVFGKASSIAGELVACEIVVAHDQDPEALREQIVAICRAHLESHQQPRSIKFVERIDLSPAGKTLRTKAL